MDNGHTNMNLSAVGCILMNYGYTSMKLFAVAIPTFMNYGHASMNLFAVGCTLMNYSNDNMRMAP